MHGNHCRCKRQRAYHIFRPGIRRGAANQGARRARERSPAGWAFSSNNGSKFGKSLDVSPSMAVIEPYNNGGAVTAGNILILVERGIRALLRRLHHSRIPGATIQLQDSGGTAENHHHRRQPREAGTHA